MAKRGYLLIACGLGALLLSAVSESPAPHRGEHYQLNDLPPEQYIDFTDWEEALGQIRVDAEASPRLDAKAEAALRKAVESLPTEPSEAVLERAALLIRKSRPAREQDAVVPLFARFNDYYRAVSALDGDDARLENEQSLQRQFFGERAQALFGEQNRLARYMQESRRIEANPELNAAEKRDRLEALQATLDRGEQ